MIQLSVMTDTMLAIGTASELNNARRIERGTFEFVYPAQCVFH